MEPVSAPPPCLPRRLGLFSLACLAVAGVALLGLALAEPAPMQGLPTAILVAALALVPVSLVLALAAILAHLRARRRAKREPDRFRAPGASGLILGLASLLLFLVTLGAAPALAVGGTRAHARDRASAENLREAMHGLASACEQARAEGVPAAEHHDRLEAWLGSRGARPNPWRPGTPAFRTAVIPMGGDPEAARRQAVNEARGLGECVFVLSENESERCLAGAVLTQGRYQPPGDDSEVTAEPSARGLVLLRSVILAD